MNFYGLLLLLNIKHGYVIKWENTNHIAVKQGMAVEYMTCV